MAAKRGGASLVAAGIFLSKIAGLVRESVFTYYFGNSAAADSFKAALRIPNFLQNLFGEGVLSASFIPVYANLVAQEKPQEAGRVAGAVFAILSLLTSILVLIGVLATPLFIDVIAAGRVKRFHVSESTSAGTFALAATAYRLAFCPLGILGGEVIEATGLNGHDIRPAGIAMIGRS